MMTTDGLQVRPPVHPDAGPAFRVRAWKIVSTVATIALVVVWGILFRPQFLRGPATFIGVDGISMTPTMHNGDLAIVETKSAYHVGDIIAYRIPAGEQGAGSKVIHRIVGGNGTTGFVTKGDHNSYTDFFWHPKTADVIGKVWFHLPRLAGLLGDLHSPGAFAGVVGVVSFALIAWPSKPKRRSGPEATEDERSLDSEGTTAPEAPGCWSEPTAVDGEDPEPVLVAGGSGSRRSQPRTSE